jgi:hypothetical protein
MVCHYAECQYAMSYFIYYYAECRYAECQYAVSYFIYYYAECLYAECYYAKCRYAECRSAILSQRQWQRRKFYIIGPWKASLEPNMD